MDIQFARNQMVGQQVRAWDVLDARVLRLFLAMPREQFVPEAYRRFAFADMPIPLAHGQTMMTPKMEGRMLQALAPQPDERVLEIGTGSGFMSACLARMASEVLSVDIFPDLTDTADKTLREFGIRNVRLETRDATQLDWLTEQFDVIAVTGSVPDAAMIPAGHLTIGGRLFVIEGRSPVMDALLLTRVAENDWSRQSLFETDLPALVNAIAPSGFRF